MAVEAGIVTGVSVNDVALWATGATLTESSEVRLVRAVKSMVPLDSFPAKVTISGSVPFIVSEKVTIDLINPTANVLTDFAVIVGTKSHTGCKASNLTLNAAVGEELKGSIAWQGLALTTGVNPAVGTGNAFKCIKITATALGTYTPISVDLTVDNGLTVIHAMNETGARVPVAIAEGFQTVSFNAKLSQINTLPVDITAADLAKIASVTMAFEDTQDSPDSLTITLTNCTAEGASLEQSPEDIVKYGINYKVETIAFA